MKSLSENDAASESQLLPPIHKPDQFFSDPAGSSESPTPRPRESRDQLDLTVGEIPFKFKFKETTLPNPAQEYRTKLCWKQRAAGKERQGLPACSATSRAEPQFFARTT